MNLNQNNIDLSNSNYSIEKTNKKLIHPNAHENSEEFKNLGTFHRERRFMQYYPQDQVNLNRIGGTNIV